MWLSKTILASLILLLFAITTLSVFYGTMAIDSHGNMAPCPLMANIASLCRMNAIEHLSSLQSLFTATTPTTALLLLAAALLLIISISSSKNLEEAHSEKIASLFINRRNHDALIFNPLRLAFSTGILNPKIYELAVSV